MNCRYMKTKKKKKTKEVYYKVSIELIDKRNERFHLNNKRTEFSNVKQKKNY